jgi:hypothetical protein
MSTSPSPVFTRARTRRALIGVELFLALNAVAGAVYAFGGAEGVKREWLDGTPFHDYVVPGVILLVVVGGSVGLAAATLLHDRSAWKLSLAAGGVLIAGTLKKRLAPSRGWLAVETLVIGVVSWMQPTTLALALLIVWLAWRLRPDRAAEL